MKCLPKNKKRGLFTSQATCLGKLVFAQWTVWSMVKAALKAFQAECMSAGCSDRFKEQPRKKIMVFTKIHPEQTLR